jgi:hypothetical protein
VLSRTHVYAAPLGRVLTGPDAHDQLSAGHALEAGKHSAPSSNWIKSIGLRLMAWVDTCADYHAAAAMYEQLSGLSDAELARRGLSRATLAHDLCTASDRNAET